MELLKMKFLVYALCHFLFIANVSALNYGYFTQKKLTVPEYTENNADMLIKSSKDEYDKENFHAAAVKLVKIVNYGEEPRSTDYFITVMSLIGCTDVYNEIYGLSDDAVCKLKEFQNKIDDLAKILKRIKNHNECCPLL